HRFSLCLSLLLHPPRSTLFPYTTLFRSLGLITVRESADSARAMAVSRRMQVDLLQTSAIVPRMSTRIDEPRDVRRMELRLRGLRDRKSTRLNSSHRTNSYAVFCLKKKKS